MNDRERRFRRIMLAVLVVLALIGFGARFAQAPDYERLPAIAQAAWVVPNVAIRSAQPGTWIL